MDKFWFGALSNPGPDWAIATDRFQQPAREAIDLCIGSVHYLNGLKPHHNGDSIIVIRLQHEPLNQPVTTLHVKFDSEVLHDYKVINPSTGAYEEGKIRLSQVFDQMRLGQELLTRVKQVSSVPDAVLISTYAPLFCVQKQESNIGNSKIEYDLYYYSQIRFAMDDALFLRTNAAPFVNIQGEAIDSINLPEAQSSAPLAWFDQAVHLHEEHPSFFNNHQYYYKKCFAGDELELKINLYSSVDIWNMTLEVYRRIKNGLFQHYRMEYRDEFQQWDNLNHVYDVAGPTHDRGYISFIPTNDGKFVVKRKWFSEDQFKRRETLFKGVEVENFDDYIREVFGLDAIPLGTFRRIRYDLNVESIKSGHIYGVFFDHCTVFGYPAALLNQCEIEYLRSRTYLPPDAEAIEPEMNEVAAWLKTVFSDMGVEFEQNYYSKLSFLRDVTGVKQHQQPTRG